MLRTRPQQMEAFQKYLREQFADRMVVHLHSRFPEKAAEESALRALIPDGVERAKEYAVEYETDVRRYFECMLLLGREFDRDEVYPWAGQILSRNDLDGETKMDEIEKQMIFGMDEPV